MKVLTTAVLMILTSVASAETVAWWRFADLGPGGGKSTAETVFTNAVDATRFPAIPHSFYQQAAPGTASDYMPSCTNVFGGFSSLRIFDPVSQASYGTTTALFCPWGGDGSGWSGGATVAGAPELYGVQDDVQGDFTYECFFRATAEGLNRTDKMEPLAGIPNTGGSEGAWSLVIREKHLWCRCSSKKSEGGYASVLAPAGQGAAVTPDVWHHAAITYSAAEKRFRIYLDYAYVTGVTFGDGYTGEIAVKEPGNLYIGKGTMNNDRSFNGEIAEARLSSVALGPEGFLRFREAPNGDRASDDPDTWGWFSMDTVDYGEGFFVRNGSLAASGIGSFHGTVVVPDGGLEAQTSSERPGTEGIVRAAMSGPAGSRKLTNGGSAAFFTNDCPNAYLLVSDGDRKLGGTSFSAELFFRTAHRVVSDGKTTSSYGLLSSDAFKLMLNQGTGRLFFRPNTAGDVDRGADISTVRLDDGAWHHLALTYDLPTQTVCVYVDFGRLVSWTGIEFKASALGSPLTVGCSRQSGAAVQNFDGWIDEVRLTGRALQPHEFISVYSGVADNQLVRIPFDGDSILLPYGFPAEAGDCVEPNVLEWLEQGCSKFVKTGSAGALIENAGACRLEGKKMSYPHVAALERANVTIEFFWRPTGKSAPWPSPLGLSGTAGTQTDIGNSALWDFYYMGSWSAAQLLFQFACVADGARKLSSAIAASPSYGNLESHQSETPGWFVSECDGKWHHVAVTLREYENEDGETHTEAVSYFDYTEKARTDMAGKLWTTGTSGLVMQNSNGVNNRLATWDIDEVRITGEVLDPSQFCRKSSGGMVLIFR